VNDKARENSHNALNRWEKWRLSVTASTCMELMR